MVSRPQYTERLSSRRMVRMPVAVPWWALLSRYRPAVLFLIFDAVQVDEGLVIGRPVRLPYGWEGSFA